MHTDRLGQSHQARCAEWLCHLLLDSDPAARGGNEAFDSEIALSVAQENGILLRTAAKFEEKSIPTSDRFSEAVRAEQRRVHQTLQMIGEVHGFCRSHGIAHVFLKAFQHYPDMGRDVDLLVLADSRHVEGNILSSLQASRLDGDVMSRIARAAVYRVASSPTLLDIQYGRLGAVGEHRDFPAVLFSRRSQTFLAACAFSVPSVEDQLILQGMQRVYGHRRIRISDVLWTITALRSRGLDWPYVIESASTLGILPGLSCYLTYVEHAYHRVLGAELLPAERRSTLVKGRWGQIEFQEGRYQFPAFWVSARLYARKLLANIRTRNWEASGRLCLIPALQAAAALLRLRRVLLRRSRNAGAGVGQGALASVQGSR